MTLLMRDQENIEKGKQQERERGIKLMIESGKELGVDRNIMFAKVAEKYNLDDKEAVEYMGRYWR